MQCVTLSLTLSIASTLGWQLNPAVLELHPHGNSIEEWRQEEERLVTMTNNKPTDQMIAEAGYPCETHMVKTEDGYLLRLHRIPGGREHTGEGDARPAVFLQHGLLSSSADWVLTGPDHAIAFLLADRGYDVWLGNYRGNTYSLGHTNTSLPLGQYWDFSWDEMAQYDLPAMLQHMMKVTNQERFHYIGHSMGTLTYYTACNYHGWIANATKLMVGYGAHTRVPHMYSPLFRLLAYYVNDLKWLVDTIGLHAFMPSSWVRDYLASKVCDEHMMAAAVCKNMLFLICGYNKGEMNSTILPVIMAHNPAGTSMITMLHYAQSVDTGAWGGYDLGSSAANKVRWNSTTPPLYKYSPVTSPVALFWAPDDWMVVPEDEADLAGSLPNLVINVRVPEDQYTHLDFIWGVHSREMVYEPTLELMAKY